MPTAVLGTWIGSYPNRLTAVLFYGGTLFVLGIASPRRHLSWEFHAFGLLVIAGCRDVEIGRDHLLAGAR